MKHIAYSIVLIGVFFYGDFSLVLRACLVFGFLSYFPLNHFKKNDKNYLHLLLLLVPSIALFISSFRFKAALTIKPVLLWTGIVILGALLRYLYELLNIRPVYKKALLGSFVMLLIIPLYRKLGEGTYAVLALLTYIIAGFLIFKAQSKNSYISLALLFGPYILVHLIDAVFSDSIQGFLLILPTFVLSLLFVIYLFFYKQDGYYNYKKDGPAFYCYHIAPVDMDITRKLLELVTFQKKSANAEESYSVYYIN